LARSSATGSAASRRRTPEEIRAALTPLAPGERPPALIVAILLAGALGLAVAIGTATIHELHRYGGSLPGGIFLSAFLLGVAFGMARRRYWAVVTFEALLVFQMLVATISLVLSNTLPAAAFSLLALALGGVLFWKLIRVMARLQVATVIERKRQEPKAGPRGASPPLPPGAQSSAREAAIGYGLHERAEL
jgi:uncharacterized membrane-anchored protein YitT (DUF2179 family)